MGARGSKCFAKTDLEEASASVASRVKEPFAVPEVSGSTTVDVAVAAAVARVGECTEPWYLEASERCAELRRTHQKLLVARKEVKACIARFAPAFESDDSDELSIPQSLLGESDADDGQPAADEEQRAEEQRAEDSEPEDEAKAEPPSYQDLLAEEEELEEEVEMLQETLYEAMAMIGAVVEKSQELSEHLDEVETQMQMPKKTNATSDTNSDDALVVQVSNASKMGRHQEQLKLPPLKFLAVPGVPGSEASSSTATPRSENPSRVASPRSESCYCEVY